MDAVQGLGGAFLYADDLDALAKWYEERLGITFTMRFDSMAAIEFPGQDLEPSARKASTTFSIFRAEKSLTGAPKTARLNFRVSDLDALVASLEAAGHEVKRDPDESYGRFAWVQDPENNRVELWEPLEE